MKQKITLTNCFCKYFLKVIYIVFFNALLLNTSTTLKAQTVLINFASSNSANPTIFDTFTTRSYCFKDDIFIRVIFPGATNYYAINKPNIYRPILFQRYLNPNTNTWTNWANTQVGYGIRTDTSNQTINIPSYVFANAIGNSYLNSLPYTTPMNVQIAYDTIKWAGNVSVPNRISNILSFIVKPIPRIVSITDTNSLINKKNCLGFDGRISLQVKDSLSNLYDNKFNWYYTNNNTSINGTLDTTFNVNTAYTPTKKMTADNRAYYFYCTISNNLGCRDSLPKAFVFGGPYFVSNKTSSIQIFKICNDKIPIGGIVLGGLTFKITDTIGLKCNNGCSVVKRDTIRNAMNCDSIRTVQLDITINKQIRTIRDTICYTSPINYSWRGTGGADRNISINDNSPALILDTQTVSYLGKPCDSIFLLRLVVNKKGYDTSRVTYCMKDTNGYKFIRNNIIYKKDTMVTVIKLPGKNLKICDSSFTLILKVNKATKIIKDTALCPGKTYNLAGKTYPWLTKDTTYKDTLKFASGLCDSIWYSVTIRSKKATDSNITKVLCSNQLPFLWKNISVGGAGNYQFDTINKAGCDSTIRLSVSIKVATISNIKETVCNNGRGYPLSYFGRNFDLSNDTTFTDTLKSVFGCDSLIINKTYIVNTFSKKDTTVFACKTCAVVFNGVTYTQAGIDTIRLNKSNSKNCDSIIYLRIIKDLFYGDNTACVNDSGNYFVQNDSGYLIRWTSNIGTIHHNNGSNDDADVIFNSAGNGYVAVSAIDTTKNNLVVYVDTIRVMVGDRHVPRLATTGGVGCMFFKDSSQNETGQWIYTIDTAIKSACTKVCAKNKYKYYVKNVNTTSAYSWAIGNGNIVSSSKDTMREIIWDTVGGGVITITETNAFGCVDSRTYCFDVVPSPLAKFVVNNQNRDTVEVCKKSSAGFDANLTTITGGGIINYNWSFGDGKTGVGKTTTHTYDSSGYYKVVLTASSGCSCAGTDTGVVWVHDSTGVNIVCNKVVCDSSIAFYSLDVSTAAMNCSPQQLMNSWSVNGGTIVKNYGNAIMVKWDKVGSGDTVYVMFDNSACTQCPAKSAIKIPVLKRDSMKITGDTVVCVGERKYYTIGTSIQGTTYTWSVTGGGKIIYTSQPNTVIVEVSGGFDLKCDYYNSLAQCGGTAQQSVVALPLATIQGTIGACSGDSLVYTATNTIGIWRWEVTDPSGKKDTMTVDTLQLQPSLAGDYRIVIIGKNSCGSNVFTTTVHSKPATPIIVGKDTVCMNENYVYKISNAQDGLVYDWSGSNNKVVFVNGQVDKQVTIQYTSNVKTYTADIKVVASNNYCVSDTGLLHIQRLKIVNSLINFNNIACANSRVTYEASYKGGDWYDWSLTPNGVGSIEQGNGTNKITVLWNEGFTTAQLKLRIRKCSDAGEFVGNYNISAATTPTLSITSNDSVCRASGIGFTLNTSTALTSASVNWNFGDGTTQTGGLTANHVYNNAITNVTPYTVTATLSNFGTSSCNANNSNAFVTRVVYAKPTPKIDLVRTLGDRCALNTALINKIDLAIDNNYGAAGYVNWTTPNGVINCVAPITNSCLSLNINSYTDTGSYNVTVGNNYGCVAKDSAGIRFNCIVTCANDSGKPTMSITGDTIANCGNVNIVGTTSYVVKSQQFNIYALNSNTYNTTGVTSNSTTSTMNYNFTRAGIYFVKYVVTFRKIQGTDSVDCEVGKNFNVHVPKIPLLDATISCGGGSYNLSLKEIGDQLTNTTVSSYDYYVDGIKVATTTSNTYNQAVTDGSHSAYVVVHFSYAGQNYSCTSNVATFNNLPTLPTAHFTISAKHCQGIPIKFTYSGKYNSSFNYNWDFKDGSSVTNVKDPSRVYDYSSQPLYPSLTINTGFCTVSYQDTVKVAENKLNGEINPKNSFVCPDIDVDIFYASSASSNTNPTNFTWYNSRNPIALLQVPVNSGGISHNPYVADRTGAYWVLVRDDNGCYLPVDGNAVVLFAEVAEPIVTSNPPKEVGIDTLYVCENSGFSISTSNGYADYIWWENGVAVSSATSVYSVAAKSLGVGVYTYRVQTKSALAGGLLCDTMSKPFYVRVLPSPAQPIVTRTHVDCSNYTLTYTATSNTPGIFRWSNGHVSVPSTTTDATIYVQGGSGHFVVFDAGIGCTSQTSFNIPYSNKEFINNLAQGCYNLCIGDTGLLIEAPKPSPVFTQWQWLMLAAGIPNYLPIQVGNNSAVQDIRIYNSGEYRLLVNNGVCSDTAATPISIYQPDSCRVKEDTCNFNVALNGDVEWSACCDSVTINYVIQNNNNSPVVYTIQNGLGLVGGIADVGGKVYTQTFAIQSTAHGSYVAKFNFYTTKGNNTILCSYAMPFEIDTVKCTSTCRKAMNYATASKPVEIIKNTELQIVPNPAKDGVNIYADKMEGKLSINVVNNMGRMVLQFKPPLTPPREGNIAPLAIDIRQLPKGLYVVQVVDEKGNVRSGKLLKE